MHGVWTARLVNGTDIERVVREGLHQRTAEETGDHNTASPLHRLSRKDLRGKVSSPRTTGFRFKASRGKSGDRGISQTRGYNPLLRSITHCNPLQSSWEPSSASIGDAL